MNRDCFSWRRLSGISAAPRVFQATGMALKSGRQRGAGRVIMSVGGVVCSLAAVVVLASSVLAACGGRAGSGPSSPSVAAPNSSSAAPGPAANTIPPGTYLVGRDIPAGLYEGEVTKGPGYWQISTDAQGANVLTNGDVTGPFYIQVKKGQYLELRGVILARAESPTPEATPTTIAAGTYWVGTDIPAGLYRGRAAGNPGYWQISSDANGAHVIVNANETGPFYVEVKKGQYLQLSGAELTPARSTNAMPTATTASDGTYLVGTDIPAGAYRGTTQGDWGSWRVSSDANGSHVIAQNSVSGTFSVQVKKGQFLALSMVKIRLVK
jgi:hypothetical protein